MKAFGRFLLKCILFAGIVLGLLFSVNERMQPVYTYQNSNWPTTSTFRQFYKMKKNSVDVLFFGSSFAVNAFDPQVIYDETGIRSYSLSSEQQSPFISYYWLREALKYQKPEAVVLETRYLFKRESNTPVNMNESFLRKSIEPMRFSALKHELVSVLCGMDPNQSEMSYYFTNLAYHTRWKEMTAEEFFAHDADHAQLKGYGPLFVTNTDHFSPIVLSDPDLVIGMDPLMEEYLGKIEDLCRDSGIELILISVPASEMHEGMHNAAARYAEEHGLDYYDYSEAGQFYEAGWDLSVENPVDHMNYAGSLRMSKIIAGLLKNRYHIEAAADDQWEETKEYGRMIGRKAELSLIQDPGTYTDALKDRSCVIFAALDDGNIPAELISAAGALGIGQAAPFLAVIDNGQAMMQDSGTQGVINRYDLSYQMKQDENGTEIILNDSLYSRKAEGLHITVYDPGLNKVIDEVCFVYENGAVRAVRDLRFMNE
ncbi:MAG: DUF1574 domain-containing protein [Solobacterium sp.]|nr:DUF1574 domain-containing protein [Solobacterium sp.]